MHRIKGDKMDTTKNVDMDEKVIIYTTINFNNEQFPEVDEAEVGEKVIIILEVECIAIRKGNEWQGSTTDKKAHATYKITKVGMCDMEEENPMDTFEEDYAQKRSDGNNKK